jgi:exopolysaccharide production protein ExoZ
MGKCRVKENYCRMPRIISIQYLRGLAALMVVANHTIPLQYGLIGAAGVDMFFVISGFIMWVVTQSRETSGAEFLYNRIIRIAPLYWIFTILLASPAASFPAEFTHVRVTLNHLLLSLAFIPHFKPFDDRVLPLLEQGWTLNYEMFFYALMAATFLFSRQLRPLIITAALLILPLVGYLVPNDSAIFSVYTNPLLLEFLFGVAIGMLWTRGLLAFKSSIYGPVLILLSFAGFAVAALHGTDAVPYRVLTWGLPSCVLVVGMLAIEARGRLINVPSWLLVGNASYSIYLGHLMVVSAVRKFTGLILNDASLNAWWVVWLITVSLATVFGIAVYRYIESPVLEMMRSRTLRIRFR